MTHKLLKGFAVSSILAMSLFQVACAHHRDVRAGADGVHRVVLSVEDRDEGAQEAIAQANHFCEQRGKSAAFVQEKSSYKGSMKESDYKNAKTAAKVVGGLGSAAWVFGGKNESAVGGIAAIGGGVADAALGNGYKLEMRFKCM